MKKNLFNKLWLRVGMIVAIMTTALAGTVKAEEYTIGWGAATGDEGTFKNFTYADAGTVSGILSFSTAKNGSSTNPAYNANAQELRLYYNSSGNGGSITLTPASGITFTGFMMTTSTSPAVKYTIDGGTATSVTATNNNTTYSVTGISATSSLMIQNVNTSNTQLRIKTIKITYTISGTPTPTCATPTFSPAAGTYTEAQNVTISTTTSGATIYYTTDGNAPTTSSSVYSTPISVSTTTTIKAMAVASGYNNSSVASATYTIEAPFVVQDGIFDFNASNYGSGYETGGVKVQSGTWTAGNVTMTTAGRNCWYLETDNTKTLRLYKTSSSDAGGSMAFAVPEGYTITKIEFEGKKVNQIVESVGSYTVAEDNKSGTWTGSTKEVTFSASSATDTQIFTKITVTYEQGTPKQNATVEISATELEVNGTPSTATVTTDGPAVTLSTSDAAVASVSGTTVTAVGAGTATITATWEEDDTYASGTATFNITVVDNTPVTSDWIRTNLADLTEDDIFVIVGKETYAMANVLVSNTQPAAILVNVSGDYLTGTITDNIKWNVSGNATDGYTFYPNGDDINYLYCSTTASSGSNTNMRVGTQTNNIRNKFLLDEDNLLVTNDSYIDRYVSLNGTTDWRGYVNTNQSTPISFFKYVGAPLPLINAADVEIAYDATIGSISYEVLNPVTGGTLTATTEADWLTLGTAASTAVPFTTSANEDLAARTASVTLTYTYGTETTTKTITVTQTGNPDAQGGENNPYTVTEALAVISSLDDGGKTDYVYTTGTITAIEEVETEQYFNATYTISDGTNNLVVFRGYYLNNAHFTSADQIHVGDVVVVYGKLQKFVKDDVPTPEIAQGNYIVSQAQTVEVTSAGYATMVAAANLVIPSGVEVYAAKVNNGATSAQLTAVTDGIPAGAAVLVKASAGTYEFTYTTETVAEITNNDLVAATAAVTANGSQYCLAQFDGVVGFYKVNPGLPIPAGKAYLQVTSSAGQAKAFYGFDDDATGIETIDNGKLTTDNGVIYNLAGQRLQKMQRGINVVNGKKILK